MGKSLLSEHYTAIKSTSIYCNGRIALSIERSLYNQKVNRFDPRSSPTQRMISNRLGRLMYDAVSSEICPVSTQRSFDVHNVQKTSNRRPNNVLF